MLGGRQVTRFKRDAEQYDVIVQVDGTERREPRDIRGIFVRQGRADGATGQRAEHRRDREPRELNHFGQRRAVTISASLAPDYALGEALNFLESSARRILPPGYAIDYNGQSRDFRESSSSLALTFARAGLHLPGAGGCSSSFRD